MTNDKKSVTNFYVNKKRKKITRKALGNGLFNESKPLNELLRLMLDIFGALGGEVVVVIVVGMSRH